MKIQFQATSNMDTRFPVTNDFSSYIADRLRAAEVPDSIRIYLRFYDKEDAELVKHLSDTLAQSHFDSLVLITQNRLEQLGIRSQNTLCQFADELGIPFVSGKTGMSERWLKILVENDKELDPDQTIQVLIVDDNLLARETVRKALRLDEKINVVGEAGTAFEAISKTRNLKPDVILLDIELRREDNTPDINGILTAYRLKTEQRDVKIIILTTFDDPVQIANAFWAGASGYIPKGGKTGSSELGEGVGDQIVQAVHCAVEDKFFFGNQVLTTAEIQRWLSKTYTQALNPQEIEIIQWMARGEISQIAAKMNVDQPVIDRYLRNIEQRINIKNQADAAAFLKKLGWG
jgi:DNA-binding NarL/FixJ family response regulator